MRVLAATPTWSLNGVNVFAQRLLSGLVAQGCDARIVLTAPWQPDPKPLPPPQGVPLDVLPVGDLATRGRRWRAMRRYLEERAPCVYLPGYDFHHSAVVPALSPRVAVLGVLHGDDPQHYEHAARLGDCWDAAVAVSPRVAERALELVPSLRARLRTIPYGVEIPDEAPAARGGAGEPLRIVYAGRLEQEQKRVLDLAAIARALENRGTRFVLEVVGGGPAREALERACAPLGAGRVRFRGILPNAEVQALLAQSDVLLSVSAHEGLPINVLEGMARGCVPVVTDVASGVRELVGDGAEGFRVPVGDVEAAADRLARLAADRALLERLRAGAGRRVRAGGYAVEEMVAAYRELALRLLAGGLDPGWRRPRGRPRPPPSESWKDALPLRVRRAGMRAKARLRGTAPP